MKLNFNTVSGSYKLQFISPCFNKLNSKNTVIVEEWKTKKIKFRNLKKVTILMAFDMIKNDI